MLPYAQWYMWQGGTFWKGIVAGLFYTYSKLSRKTYTV